MMYNINIHYPRNANKKHGNTKRVMPQNLEYFKKSAIICLLKWVSTQ
jgi:hypothetical protein